MSATAAGDVSPTADPSADLWSMESLDVLSADFRAHLGIVDDDDGLTDVFKARIGLLGNEELNQVAEMEVTLEEEKEETFARFKYQQFCKQYFQKGHTGTFSKDPLKEPLLIKEHEVDRVASLSIWMALQRYMGDGPRVQFSSSHKSRTPMMTRLYRTFETFSRGRRSSSSENNEPKEKEVEEFKLAKRSSLKKLLGQKSTDKKAEKPLLRSSLTSGLIEYSTNPQQILEIIPTNERDLIHFIVGHGILRRDLRDETYCQILKQMTKNPNSVSEARGWMMLAMCTGCYLPEDELRRYLRCFLRDCSRDFIDFSSYIRRLVKRTLANGTRYHPPNVLEHQATQVQKYVMLPVALPDRRHETLQVDAATTASEICSMLANRIGLTDQFGFSVFICVYDKVSSLGSGGDHVMDAISECEQISNSKGRRSGDSPWRLYFRKEIFSPWHDPGYDHVSTELIYWQIARGVRNEEYKIEDEEELSRHAAHCFYADHGDIIPGKLQANLHKYLPQSAIQAPGKSRDTWIQNILSTSNTLGLGVGMSTPYNDKDEGNKEILRKRAKEAIVRAAPYRWPLQFSGLFEAFRIGGPRIPRNEAVLAVNSTGFYILDKPFEVAATIPIHEVVDVFRSKVAVLDKNDGMSFLRGGRSQSQSFSLVSIRGDEYTFISPNADTITKLMTYFLGGLRKRSNWVIGLQEFHMKAEGTGRPFSFKQGDVIAVLSEDSSNKRDGWLYGEVQVNKTRGHFPADTVYIIPTVQPPPAEFLSLFGVMTKENVNTLPRRRGSIQFSRETIGRYGTHGIETHA